MTIERPMFPPRAQSNNVVAFADFNPKRRKPPERRSDDAFSEADEHIRQILDEEIARAEGELSTTAKNGRLRKERSEAWARAEATTRYWRVRLDFDSAVGDAQSNDVPEGRLHPAVNRDDWMPMVDRYRKALVEQLVTPAWNVASVTWKRSVLARNDYVIGRYVKAERVERAIADDEAFLAAHPVRQSIRRKRS
jgi:hypothetical protein